MGDRIRQRRHEARVAGSFSLTRCVDLRTLNVFSLRDMVFSPCEQILHEGFVSIRAGIFK
jgi:hypothetical protein